MMSSLFLRVVSLSLSASIVTALVLLLRALLKKAPRAISCALWVLVGLRLILPSLPESRVSVIPEGISDGAAVNELQKQVVEETVTVREDVDPALYRQITVQYKELPIYRDEGHNYVVVSAAPAHTPPKTFGESVVPVLAVIWIAGAGLMLLYMAGSYVAIRRRLRTAVRMEDGVWESDKVTSPFILGLVRPRIYLPTSLSAEEAAFVLAHEKTHIKRGDQIWKPLGFLLLSAYWFNPLFWLAYYLLCRDIEAACDEKVIREQDAAYRKAYSETLLALNIRERTVSACPLAFAENGVKERIKNILSYRKPAFWLIVTALVVSIAAAGCALTDPSKKSTEIETEENPEETQETVKGGLGIYAAEKIEASFSFDANGRPVYPDDYAGWYPDGKDMILCLKDPTEESINRYLEIAVFKDSVHVKKVSRSYNELEQMLSETAEELQAEKIQIIYYCVDVENNGLRFCVTKDFVETVRALLQDKYPGVPSTVEGAEPFNYPEWTTEGSSEIPGTEGSSAETPEVRIPLSGKYHLTGRQYTERGALTFDLESMEFFFPISEPFSSRLAYAGGLLIEDGILYAVDYGMIEMDEFTATHAETVNKMRRNGWAFPFRIVDEKTLEYIGDSYALEVAKRYVKNGDLLVWKDPLPEKTEPSDADPAETGPGEISPDGNQGGTSLINPESVTGTYTFSEGMIQEYVGEWEGIKYFLVSYEAGGRPDVHVTAVGVAKAEANGGPIRILAELGSFNYLYPGTSNIVDGILYLGTEAGYLSVDPAGEVRTLVSKNNFRPFQSLGHVLLYSWGDTEDTGGTYAPSQTLTRTLEAYDIRSGETIRFESFTEVITNDKEGSTATGTRLYNASALNDSGFYYTVQDRESGESEIRYQPFDGGFVKRIGEPTLWRHNYVAGTEDFLVDVRSLQGSSHATIEVLPLDGRATLWQGAAVAYETGSFAWMRTVQSTDGTWHFCNPEAWFDINDQNGTSVFYTIDADNYTGKKLECWNSDGTEIVLCSDDREEMLFVPYGDSEDATATPVEDVSFIRSRTDKQSVQQAGLSAVLEAVGSCPVFRLQSVEDKEIFQQIFKEDIEPYSPYEKEYPGLAAGMAPYDEAFFRDHDLFIVYAVTGNGLHGEERFAVDRVLKGKTLHFRVNVENRSGWMDATEARYWVFLPAERSDVRDVIAYDATWTVQAFPPDWTEGVNPDWRKQ